MRSDQWPFLLGCFVALAVLTSGCAGKPSDQQIEAAIKREHRDLIRVVKLLKGAELVGEHPLTGRIVYELSYEAEIEWLEPVTVERQAFGIGGQMAIHRQGDRRPRVGIHVGVPRNFRKGDREHISRVLCFDKTSEGWKHRMQRAPWGCG